MDSSSRQTEEAEKKQEHTISEDMEQSNDAKSQLIVKKMNFQRVRHVLSRMKLLYVRMPRIIVLLRDRLTVMGMEYDRKQIQIYQQQHTLRDIGEKMTMFHQTVDGNPKSVTDEMIDEVGENIVTDIQMNDALAGLRAELDAMHAEMRKIESKIDYANRFLHTCDTFAAKLTKRFGRFGRNLQTALTTCKDEFNARLNANINAENA